MKPAVRRQAREYLRDDGSAPFANWLKGLRDVRARARVVKSVNKMQTGNFGDHKSVGEGVMEYRIDYGPGYRLYYALDGDELIILFCGGDKSSQAADIRQAKRFWHDYQQRNKSGH